MDASVQTEQRDTIDRLILTAFRLKDSIEPVNSKVKPSLKPALSLEYRRSLTELETCNPTEPPYICWNEECEESYESAMAITDSIHELGLRLNSLEKSLNHVEKLHRVCTKRIEDMERKLTDPEALKEKITEIFPEPEQRLTHVISRFFSSTVKSGRNLYLETPNRSNRGSVSSVSSNDVQGQGLSIGNKSTTVRLSRTPENEKNILECPQLLSLPMRSNSMPPKRKGKKKDRKQ